MNIKADKKLKIVSTKDKLSDISKILKSEFFGIDHVIDDICRIIEPWLLFPEHFTRPLVVNLWGMTGVGKTSLVNRLSELLEMKDLFIKLDMEQCSYRSMRGFDDDMKIYQENPCIIRIDEFQHFRTIDENGMETGNLDSNKFWELLDNGRMEYSADSLDASVSEFYQYYEFLKTCIKRNVIVDKGIIVANAETYIRLAHETFDEYNSFYFSPDEYNYIDKKADNNIFHRVDLIEKKKYNGKIRFLAKTHLMFVYEALAEQFADFPEFEKHVKSLDAYGTVKLIQKAIYKSFKPQILNMSKSLVFILGNIDEAFHMNSVLNPDNSADIFHKHTLRIGITEINNALQKRFRNEQISRLGNNHIIYPALSSEAYSKIIAAHIRDFRQRVKKSFQLNLEIDPSVNEIIYKEGVFPVMGARPLKTTFVNLIESYFTNVISDIITSSSDVESLSWTYDSDKAQYLIKCFNSDAETVGAFSYPVQLKVESKRKSLLDDKQALVGTHEAGHAIASMMTTKIIPVSITSTAVTDSHGGSCDTGVDDNIISFKMLKNKIVTSLGGYLAEQLIFGKEMTTSGSETDIENATGLAATAIISLAMGSEKANIGVEDVHTQHTLFRTEKHEREISDLLSRCTSECEQILERNKTLLIEMSNYLSDHPLMESAKIKEFTVAHSAERWAQNNEFIKSEEYYNYRSILKIKHAELHNEYTELEAS